MDVLVVVAVIGAKPEHRQELEGLLGGLVAPTLAEEGCIRYEMNVSEDGLTFVFTEQWASRPAWERHMGTTHLERFKASMDRLVAGFELFTLKPADAAGGAA